MSTFESFPDLKILSDDEGEAPDGRAIQSGPIYLVGLLVFPNGGNPKYSFTNLKGGCHSRDKHNKDHFNPIDEKGNKGPKSYRIQFMIFQTKGSTWRLETPEPVKFIDSTTKSFYSAKVDDDTSFTLTINENNTLPANPYHSFNIYLIETQPNGGAMRRRIDPIVDNPPK